MSHRFMNVGISYSLHCISNKLFPNARAQNQPIWIETANRDAPLQFTVLIRSMHFKLSVCAARPTLGATTTAAMTTTLVAISHFYGG